MRIKKIGAILLAIMLVIGLTAGCGGGGSAPQGGGSAPQGGGDDIGPAVHFKLGHSLPETDYRAVGANYFAELVEEMSGGNMTITVYPSSTLTTSQNMVQLVGGGSAEMANGALSFAASIAPDLGALDIVGTYDPRYWREAYVEIRDIVDEILAPHNVKLLIMFDETDSVFYINKTKQRAVHVPEDIVGLRLRDHGIWVGRTLSAWGASPMTVPTDELAVALERGTVDGGYTGWSLVNAFRVYELTPIITFPYMSKSTWSPICVNLQVWNSLTQAQRDILTEAAIQTEAHTDGMVEQMFVDFKGRAIEAGCEFYEMTPEESAVFTELAKPVIEQFRSEAGELGTRLLDKMLEVKARYN